MPVDLLNSTAGGGWGALEKTWTVSMGEGEMKFFSGFTLGVFAPRKGKRGACSSQHKRQSNATTLQGCFLDCAKDTQCENILLGAVQVDALMAKPPPISCQLLGAIQSPGSACTAGAGTLVTKLPRGRGEQRAKSPRSTDKHAQLTSTPRPTDKNDSRDRDWTECWGRWADEGELGPLVASTEEMLLPAMGPRC
eukprot:COSAG01_NODE_1824_length_9141_cov_10.234461_2_plen_194_part_00